MNGLLVVALVCAAGTLHTDCTRETAIDVVIGNARTPMECMLNGEATLAATGLAQGGYVKVLCERRRTAQLD